MNTETTEVLNLLNYNKWRYNANYRPFGRVKAENTGPAPSHLFDPISEEKAHVHTKRFYI